MSAARHLAIAAVVLALLGLAAWWWQRNPPVTVPPVPPVAEPTPVATPAAEPAPASAPAIRHPIEPPATAQAAPPAAPDLEDQLLDLFGRKTVLALLRVDGFARRVAITVDNLGREQAPSRFWPAQPTPGRLVVQAQGGNEVIGLDNGQRYTPFVLMAETVDLRQVVALYRRMYPLFQQSYEEIGYPGRYFNDRLVEVIDLLLATPEPAGPLRVRLPVADGPVQPKRPWVLYEFEDPALRPLSAGQKILLRMGPVNERRVKARLTELRRLVASPAR
ncbi:MAG: DUF3014 domain-containing protein [Piscinibacter sp.]|nr:DUF3014 domain-containing protein [Piscinibacter sp.]